MWTWDAIAQECESTLGPAGYGWVMTSPPQESIKGEEWWTAYQPVSYQVESRLGTREQFQNMVDTCKGAGVEVIADAVINHMTGQDAPGVGWAGSEYSHYDYPGIYSDTDGDFHHCGLTPNDDIVDYRDAEQVQTCELSNLADLATETDHVRETLHAYLEDLLSLGVAGFRIDAAKHISPDDIAAIISGLPEGTVIMQEVIQGSGEGVQPEQYVKNGKVFDFAYGRELAMFLRMGKLGDALGGGVARAGGLTSSQAVVFVDNHDVERNSSTVSYSSGLRYELANVLMLAGDYGEPVVYSGYAFPTLEPDLGPAQDSDGAVIDAVCPTELGARTYAPQEWVCQHRWQAIEGMVGWRMTAGQEPVADVEAEPDHLAMHRGEAVLLMNSGAEDNQVTYVTPLPAGTYCDVITGVSTAQGCSGGSVEVDEGGTVSLTVPGQSAIAFHVGSVAGAGEADAS